MSEREVLANQAKILRNQERLLANQRASSNLVIKNQRRDQGEPGAAILRQPEEAAIRCSATEKRRDWRPANQVRGQILAAGSLAEG